MRDKIKRILTKDNLIKIICMISAFHLVVIDVFRNSGTGTQWACANNCIGFCIFAFIVVRYNAKDFLKLPYYIWTAVFVVSFIPIYNYLKPDSEYRYQTLTALLNVGLYGILIIRLIYQYFSKKNEKNNRHLTLIFVLWFIMMGWAALSVNKSLWPLWFLVIFMCYYLAPLDKKTMGLIFEGICNGIILAFFYYQSKAFLHRPYDELRYKGVYFNCNINAMFYGTTYVAWLGKLAFLRRKKANKWAYGVCFVFTAAMWDFLIFTMSRACILAFIAVTIVFLVSEEILIYKTRFRGFFKKGVLLFVVAVMMFLPVYGCIRYIPALRHHPIWIGDYSEDKVHSFDPINSEKYTDLNEFFGTFLGRFDYSEEGWKPDVEEYDPADYADTEKGSSKYNPIYSEDEVVYTNVFERALDTRLYVYKYYFGELNLWGHEDSFKEIWITPTFSGHAHNSYLMIGYWFGIVPFAALVLLCVITPVITLKKAKKEGENLPWYCLFSVCGIVFFSVVSLTETACILGEFPFVLLMLSLLPFVTKEKESEIGVRE